MTLLTEFQSTLPRGERPAEATGHSAPKLFQSTLPRGERRPSFRENNELYLFQSTLPRGERPPATVIELGIPCFNPRSRGGSDGRVERH